MPQEFHVVQCYNCQTFQVHQVKKTTKWACKMCGEKQSLKKVFGRGSGAECRQHVQRLNTMRGELDTLSSKSTSLYDRNDHQYSEDDSRNTGSRNIPDNKQDDNISQQNKETKWTMFVEENQCDNVDDDGDEDDDRFTTDTHVFKEAGKRKRENKSDIGGIQNTKWGKYTKYSSEDQPYENNNFDEGGPLDNESSFQRKPMLTDSEDGYIRNSLTPFGKVENKHPTFSSFGRKYGSRISFQEREITEETYAEMYQGIKTTLPDDDFTFKQRERSENFPVETVPCSSYLPSSTKADRKLQRNYKNDNKNIAESSRWGMFAESDTASQNTCSESSQEPNVDMFDSRPYVTFDPEEIENTCKDESIMFNSRKTKEMNQVKHGESYTCQADNDIMSVTSNASKWTSYIASEETANSKWNHFNSSENTQHTLGHSENGISSNEAYYLGNKQNNEMNYTNNVNKTNAEKENMFPNGKSSKWGTFTENYDNFGVKDLDVKNVKPNFNHDTVVFSTSRKDIKNRRLNCHGDKSNTGDFVTNARSRSTSDKNKTVAPVFTLGELDDTDFEL